MSKHPYGYLQEYFLALRAARPLLVLTASTVYMSTTESWQLAQWAGLTDCGETGAKSRENKQSKKTTQTTLVHLRGGGRLQGHTLLSYVPTCIETVAAAPTLKCQPHVRNSAKSATWWLYCVHAHSCIQVKERETSTSTMGDKKKKKKEKLENKACKRWEREFIEELNVPVHCLSSTRCWCVLYIGSLYHHVYKV